MAQTRAQEAAKSNVLVQKPESRSKKVPAEKENAKQTSPTKKRRQVDNKETVHAKKAKKDEARSSQDSNLQLSRLISTYGVLPLQDLNLHDSTTSKSVRILALVLNAMLTSTRISHRIANATLKCVIEAKYHHLESLEGSTWEERTQVLTKGGYTHYREKTATALGDLAKLLRDKYDGDFNNLLLRAKSSPQKIRSLLKEIKGLGNVGIDIFFGSAQSIWPCLAPFIDSRNMETAKRIGLSSDVKSLWLDVGKDPTEMCRLSSALTTVRLEKKDREFD